MIAKGVQNPEHPRRDASEVTDKKKSG